MNPDVTPSELREAAARARAANPRSPLGQWLDDEARRLEAATERWAALATRSPGRKGASITVAIHDEVPHD